MLKWFAMGLIGLLVVVLLAGMVALEIGLLMLLGMEFESWGSVLALIFIAGIIEFGFTAAMEAFVETKAKSHQRFHKWCLQVIISFTVLMAVAQFITGLYLPVQAAIGTALVTATLYLLFNGKPSST